MSRKTTWQADAKRMARFTQLAVVSAQEAMADAGFTLDEAEADRCGVIVSSGIGGLFLTEAEHDKGKEKGWDRVSPFYIPMGICQHGRRPDRHSPPASGACAPAR